MISPSDRPGFINSLARSFDYFRSIRKGLPAGAHELKRFGELADHISGMYRRSFSTHHESGQSGRLYGDWGTSYDTPYWNLSSQWKSIIARSIKAIDNDPNAKGILNAIVSNAIRTGLRPTPRVKTSEGRPIDGINKRLSELWERYNDEWDATGQQTFYEAQQMVLTEIIRCGTVLTNKAQAPSGNMLGTCTEILNCLRLDTAYDQNAPKFSMDPRTKQTVFGIELDSLGRPLWYHIQGMDKKISAVYMRHHYKRISAEEWIGLPWFSCALRYLWALEKLIEDKLIASRIQAMVALFVPDELMNRILKQQLNSDSQVEMEPGKIFHGPANAKPEIIQADDSIKDVLNPLQRMLLHAVGMTFGISYMTFTRDVTEINMAAGKINTNEDHKIYRLVQKWLAKNFCQWEWDWFVYQSVKNGLVPNLELGTYLDNEWKYNQCQWNAPGFDFVDPYREAQAIDVLHKGKKMTLQEWYATKGMDWKDAIDQLEEEAEYILSKQSIQKLGIAENPKAVQNDQGGDGGNAEDGESTGD